jgi:hypothetical protein
VPDATDPLKQDYRTVEELFERYKAGDRRVVKQICHEPTVPTAIEEEFVYPLLPQVGGGDELRQEGEREYRHGVR